MLNLRCSRFLEYSFGATGMTKTISLFIGAIVLMGQVGCATSLLNASASGDTKTVLLLLHDGHQANEAWPIVGTRPLMLAAAHGHAETARVLLDAGADVNAEDLTGWTALHAGAFHGNAAVVSLLLARGAIQQPGQWFLKSPLEIADMLGHKDVLPLLTDNHSPTVGRVVYPHSDSPVH
jgi:ankyrin repeat protein